MAVSERMGVVCRLRTARMLEGGDGKTEKMMGEAESSMTERVGGESRLEVSA